MTDFDAARPRVFLSSVFREKLDGNWKDLPLRKRIIEAHSEIPIRLWAYELFWPEGQDVPKPDADTIIDRCFAGIRNCDLFVFLRTKRHGTGVDYIESRLVASYLEMELFAAAILQKPVLVLHERGYEPEPALRDTLNLLQRAFPPDRYVIDNADALYARFCAECRQLLVSSSGLTSAALARLPDYMSRWRSRRRFHDELSDPKLLFLDANLRSSSDTVSPEKARLLLDQVASGKRGPTSKPQIIPHGAALFRLWAAMRELMDSRSSKLGDSTLAPLWDQAFGLWATHSSWFGLHGHLWMGPLASVQMQIELRRKFVTEPAFREAVDVREPLGARASALYSVAQRMQSRSQKLRHFELAAKLATRAIEQDSDSRQGARLIRGHASMQIARLGYVWRFWDAIHDFKATLEARERRSASAVSVGEAKVALGQSLVLTGRRRSGLAMVQEGVDLMRDASSANAQAFLARGLRSLERCARIARQPEIAEDARKERLSLADSIEAIDQKREPTT